jgi:tripeptide aminopeptidase
MKYIDRFIKYVQIDTQSDEGNSTAPSTEKQLNLSKLLVEELKQLGLTDAYLDEYGIVYAHLKGDGKYTIGLNAHVDTATNISGKNVKPQIVNNYQGGDIKLNDTYTLSPNQFPSLNKHINKSIITTSGDTLLGADDKAGIAIIMGVLQYFHDNPQVKHHNISVSFTCDEEIGRGAKHFSLEKMNADFAYTIDGAGINEIDYENFNAKGVKLTFEGVAIHPGSGKNQLINAVLLLNEFLNMMPENDNPYHSSGKEGFWHIDEVNGNSETLHAEMILRDFDLDRLNHRVDVINNAISYLNNKYPKTKSTALITDSYSNMYPYVMQKPYVIDIAKAAIEKNGLVAKSNPIRGGTDGATFSKMGLVTPNLGTGSYNHHGRFEYLVIEDFLKMIDIVVDILKI